MKIRDFETENNVFLAPMAGVTDSVFRVICKGYGCGLVYTEMISSKGLFYGSEKTDLLMDIDNRESPIAVQIFGDNADIMGAMAKVVSQNPDVALIDINMGCPAPKVVKNGEGSALMKDIKLASSIVRKVVDNSEKPVTVKFRKGWDDFSINAVEFAKAIEYSGANAVTIHGRTRAQMFEGKVDLDIIKAVKEAINIPVIGNGDIIEPEDAKRMLDYTGCDGIMIGRGCYGRPWIFQRILSYLESGIILPDAEPGYKIDAAIKHLNMMYDYSGEHGVVEMRKHMAWYLKGIKNASSIRDTINKINEKDDIIDLLLKFKGSLC